MRVCDLLGEPRDVWRHRAPIRFSLVAVNVDSGYKEYKHDVIARTCESHGWEYRIEHTSIGEVIEDILDRGLSVAIGAEHGFEPLAACALVLAPVAIEGEVAGTIGVVGPTRMH